MVLKMGDNGGGSKLSQGHNRFEQRTYRKYVNNYFELYQSFVNVFLSNLFGF